MIVYFLFVMVMFGSPGCLQEYHDQGDPDGLRKELRLLGIQKSDLENITEDPAQIDSSSYDGLQSNISDESKAFAKEKKNWTPTFADSTTTKFYTNPETQTEGSIETEGSTQTWTINLDGIIRTFHTKPELNAFLNEIRTKREKDTGGMRIKRTENRATWIVKLSNGNTRTFDTQSAFDTFLNEVMMRSTERTIPTIEQPQSERTISTIEQTQSERTISTIEQTQSERRQVESIVPITEGGYFSKISQHVWVKNKDPKNSFDIRTVSKSSNESIFNQAKDILKILENQDMIEILTVLSNHFELKITNDGVILQLPSRGLSVSVNIIGDDIKTMVLAGDMSVIEIKKQENKMLFTLKDGVVWHEQPFDMLAVYESAVAGDCFSVDTTSGESRNKALLSKLSKFIPDMQSYSTTTLVNILKSGLYLHHHARIQYTNILKLMTWNQGQEVEYDIIDLDISSGGGYYIKYIANGVDMVFEKTPDGRYFDKKVEDHSINENYRSGHLNEQYNEQHIEDENQGLNNGLFWLLSSSLRPSRVSQLADNETMYMIDSFARSSFHRDGQYIRYY